jgi:hypothetical protein
MFVVYSDDGATLLLCRGMGDAVERGAIERGFEDRRRFREGLSDFSISSSLVVADIRGDAMTDGV